MPKVSVIMGVYNTNDEKMLRAAIESILNQTFKNFEFIICDDGSTDNTYEIVKKIICNDSRCILIKNNKNLGLAKTLNNCLDISKGEYIARMDADDESELTRFETEVNFLDNNQDFSLVSGWASLYDNKCIFGTRKNVEFPKKKDMLFGPPFIHAAVMIRKEILIGLDGYRVSTETLRAEDYDLWMRLYEKGYKGYNIQKIIYRIREDDASYKRRRYKYRIDEARVRYNGFKKLGLLPAGFIYVLKPIVVGLIPQKILAILRREKKNTTNLC